MLAAEEALLGRASSIGGSCSCLLLCFSWRCCCAAFVLRMLGLQEKLEVIDTRWVVAQASNIVGKSPANNPPCADRLLWKILVILHLFAHNRCQVCKYTWT